VRGRRLLLVFVGLQLGQIMSRIDGTIVATALPTIARDLGGLARISWVVTAYFLGQVLSLPLMGKLGDLYGRKRLWYVAITVFITGSMLCGAAGSLNQLLVFPRGAGTGWRRPGDVGDGDRRRRRPRPAARALARLPGRDLRGEQHRGAVGGRAVHRPAELAVVVLHQPADRARRAGDRLHDLHLPYRRIPHAIDFAGAALLTGALTSGVVLISAGGEDLGWASPASFALGASALVPGVLFVARQRRAPEPVVPLRLFADRVLQVVLALNLTSGILLF